MPKTKIEFVAHVGRRMHDQNSIDEFDARIFIGKTFIVAERRAVSAENVLTGENVCISEGLIHRAPACKRLILYQI